MTNSPVDRDVAEMPPAHEVPLSANGSATSQPQGPSRGRLVKDSKSLYLVAAALSLGSLLSQCGNGATSDDVQALQRKVQSLEAQVDRQTRALRNAQSDFQQLREANEALLQEIRRGHNTISEHGPYGPMLELQPRPRLGHSPSADVGQPRPAREAKDLLVQQHDASKSLA